MSQTRRDFVKTTLAAAATITIAGTKSSGTVLGANDTIRVGVAGLNGRGSAHIGAFAGMKDVQITYLIDPDTRTFGKRLRAASKNGVDPQTVQDVRKALDDKNLDAISIATPNHWHALMTIWACQAGKDVYVEKPCSHNIHEGRIAVETARKFGRIVQHGTQSRASASWAKLLDITKSGQLGKLLVSRGLCYKLRGSIGQKPETSPPAEVDFNIWLGPASERPFHGNLVHYNWHWFWDFGNGDIGNQGVHEMDKARWMIPGATWPKSVISLGGRFGYTDQGETPNTQIAIFDYGETQLIFEVRGLPTPSFDKAPRGVANTLHYEAGTIVEGKFYPKGKTEPAPLPEVKAAEGRRPSGNIFNNFIAAIRSRKHTELDADILEGHISSGLGHLANISYRLGTKVPFNAPTKAFGDNKEAYETFARMQEQLSTGNKLKLEGETYQLGRKLMLDGKTEQFVNDTEANRLLTREYRKPFEVPDRVLATR
jgi:predicted dehydrogenase